MTTARLFKPTAAAPMKIAVGLYCSAGILLAFAGVIIVVAMGWTTTAEALARAAWIAAAFGLFGTVLFLLAYWLEGIRRDDDAEKIVGGDDIKVAARSRAGRSDDLPTPSLSTPFLSVPPAGSSAAAGDSRRSAL